MNAHDFGQWATYTASCLAIATTVSSFLYISMKWMFEKLNKNNALLTEKVDAIHRELQGDMQEIRKEHKEDQERYRQDQKQFEERLEKRRREDMAIANARIDETNKRIDASLDRIDKAYHVLMSRFKETNVPGSV